MSPFTIEEGFAHLASERYAEIEFIVDLKLPGYEERVVDALNAAGLRDPRARLLHIQGEPRAPARL